MRPRRENICFQWRRVLRRCLSRCFKPGFKPRIRTARGLTDLPHVSLLSLGDDVVRSGCNRTRPDMAFRFTEKALEALRRLFERQRLLREQKLRAGERSERSRAYRALAPKAFKISGSVSDAAHGHPSRCRALLHAAGHDFQGALLPSRLGMSG